MTDPPTPSSPTRSSLAEIAAVFLRLGVTSFGGPVAHLAYFHYEFVTRRRWLDEAAFADLVALCQFLPGPASSQLVFAVGQQRAKLPGALLASLCFLLPSALLMIAFAYGVTTLGDVSRAGWLHGLKLAAVAVVAQAVWTLGRTLCPDIPRALLALLTAACALRFPGAGVQIGCLAGGALFGALWYRRELKCAASEPVRLGGHHAWAAACLVLCGTLLFVLPVLAGATGQRELGLFDRFYRAGSLVFGGGHVVLPLLRAEMVPTGLMTDDTFLAGYGAAQAVPGPLFSFAAYLGTILHGAPHAWVGGLWCLFAIFLPAWLLIGGALPFWQLLRHQAGTHAALHGANAAVVGILLAALYHPVWQEGITGPRDIVAFVVALAALQWGRVPPWLVVALAAAAGQWLL